MRVGLIGAGRWGRNFVRVLGSRLEAVVDSELSVREELEGKVPLVCSSVQDPAFWAAITAVIIVSPARFHEEHTLLAIEKGIRAIFVEKPLAPTLEATRRILNQIRQQEPSPPFLHVGYIVPFIPEFEALGRCVALNSPHQITEIQCVRAGPSMVVPGCPVEWDLMVHDVAAVFYLLFHWYGVKELKGLDFVSKGALGGGSREAVVEIQEPPLLWTLSASGFSAEKRRVMRILTREPRHFLRTFIFDDVSKRVSHFSTIQDTPGRTHSEDIHEFFPAEPLSREVDYFLAGGDGSFTLTTFEAIAKFIHCLQEGQSTFLPRLEIY